MYDHIHICMIYKKILHRKTCRTVLDNSEVRLDQMFVASLVKKSISSFTSFSFSIRKIIFHSHVGFRLGEEVKILSIEKNILLFASGGEYDHQQLLTDSYIKQNYA